MIKTSSELELSSVASSLNWFLLAALASLSELLISSGLCFFFREFGSHPSSAEVGLTQSRAVYCFLFVNSSKCIYTPNREFHVTYFPKRTEILVFNGQARDQNIYEDDLVRRDLVKNENIHSLLNKFNAKRSV